MQRQRKHCKILATVNKQASGQHCSGYITKWPEVKIRLFTNEKSFSAVNSLFTYSSLVTLAITRPLTLLMQNTGQEHTHDQKSVTDSSFLFPPFSLLPYRGSFYPVSNPSGLHAHTRIHTHTEPTSPSMGLSTGLQSRPHSFSLELQKLHTGPHIPASEMSTATITT